MKKLEIILIIGAVIGLFMTLLDVPQYTLVVSVSFLGLGLLYFYLGFALFNNIRFRKIFISESYKGIGSRRLGTAIGAGVSLSIITMGIMFTLLSYPMARTLLTCGSGLAVIILILALVKNIREKNDFYTSIFLRCLVGIIAASALLLFYSHL